MSCGFPSLRRLSRSGGKRDPVCAVDAMKALAHPPNMSIPNLLVPLQALLGLSATPHGPEPGRPKSGLTPVRSVSRYLGLVLSLFALPAGGAEPKAVSLADLLKFQTEHPGESRASAPLAPEWIGMIQRTHVVGDDHGVYKDPEKPTPVRLNYGGIEPHGTKKKTTDIILMAARRTTDGSLDQ